MTSPARPSSDLARLARCGPCAEILDGSDQAMLFKALADPNRITLLARLADCGRPCTVSEIACCLPLDLSVVSRHLSQLRAAGILESERRGKEVYYHVQHRSLVQFLRALADAIEVCCTGDEECCAGKQPRTTTRRNTP